MSAAQSAARLKMLYEPGYLYAAYSRYCDWVKIGFTSKTGRERLEAVEHQYPLFAPFSLIGEARSTWRAEQQLHGLMAPFRQRKTASTKELYPAVYAVMDLVKHVSRHREWPSLEWEYRQRLREWIRARAEDPLNRVLALESFALFEDERRAEVVAGAIMPAFLQRRPPFDFQLRGPFAMPFDNENYQPESIGDQRLRILADFLPTTPPEKFNICSWAACACGWAATIPAFAEQGFRLIRRPGHSSAIAFGSLRAMDAAAEFFGLSRGRACHLFSMQEYPNRYATPADVAARIREHLAAKAADAAKAQAA